MVPTATRAAIRQRRLLPVVLLLVAALAGCSTGPKADPAVRVEDVWSRPALAMRNEAAAEESHGEPMDAGGGAGGTGAVFLTLVNDTQQPDRLLRAHADIADATEIHETTIVDEVMRMRPVPHVEIPAGGEVKLKPGSYHIMLIGLLHNLEMGDRFDVTLTLERSGTLIAEAEVREP